MFLLANRSVLETCDEDFIQNLNFHYRKMFLQKYLATIEATEDLRTSILYICNILQKVLNLMPSDSIKKLRIIVLFYGLKKFSFSKARFFLNPFSAETLLEHWKKQLQKQLLRN